MICTTGTARSAAPKSAIDMVAVEPEVDMYHHSPMRPGPFRAAGAVSVPDACQAIGSVVVVGHTLIPSCGVVPVTTARMR